MFIVVCFPHYTFTLDPVEDKARPGFVAKLETKIKLLLNLNSTQPHHNQIFSRILGVLHEKSSFATNSSMSLPFKNYILGVSTKRGIYDFFYSGGYGLCP